MGAMSLSASMEAFLSEPHLATLTTLRPDGSPPGRVVVEIAVDRVMSLNN
ncbi:pyridoxamine 5'-phosphate oxidase family protein [Streptosporangium canum]